MAGSGALGTTSCASGSQHQAGLEGAEELLQRGKQGGCMIVGQCGGGELCAGGCFKGKVLPVSQAVR